MQINGAISRNQIPPNIRSDKKPQDKSKHKSKPAKDIDEFDWFCSDSNHVLFEFDKEKKVKTVYPWSKDDLKILLKKTKDKLEQCDLSLLKSVDLSCFFSQIEKDDSELFQIFIQLECQFLTIAFQKACILQDEMASNNDAFLKLQLLFVRRYSVYSAVISILKDHQIQQINGWLENLESYRQKCLLPMSSTILNDEVQEIEILKQSYNEFIANLKKHFKLQDECVTTLEFCEKLLSENSTLVELCKFERFDWFAGIRLYDKLDEHLKLQKKPEVPASIIFWEMCLFYLGREQNKLYLDIPVIAKHWKTYLDYQSLGEVFTPVPNENETDAVMAFYSNATGILKKLILWQEKRILEIQDDHRALKENANHLRALYGISLNLVRSKDDFVNNFPISATDHALVGSPQWDLLKSGGAFATLEGTMKVGWENFFKDFYKKSFTSEENKRCSYYKLSIQIILKRCIDNLGECRRSLRFDDLSPGEKKIQKLKAEAIDQIYEDLLLIIVKLPASKQTLYELLINEAKEIFLFGYFSTTEITIEEIHKQKQLADLGYCMTENLKSALKGIKIQPGENWQDVMTLEIKKFLHWADKNPHLAADMCGDIFHAISKLGSDNPFSHVLAGLKARTIAHSFLGKLGENKKESFVITEDYLKFLALRDFCYYLPQIFTCMKSISDLKNSTGLFNLILNACTVPICAFYVTSVEQKIIHRTPMTWAIEMMAVISLVRGDSFRQILQSNAEIQMLKFAGMARKAWLNPSHFWNYLELEFLKWWQPISQSSFKERVWRVAVHAALPAAALIGMGLSLWFFSLATAVLFSFGLLTASYALYRVFSKIVDVAYHRNTSYVASKTFAKEHLHRDHEALAKIHSKAKQLIDNSYRSFALLKAQKITTTPEVERWLQSNHNTINLIAKNIKRHLNQGPKDTISDLFNTFNDRLNPENLKNRLWNNYFHLITALPESEQELGLEALAHKFISRMEREWLKGKTIKILKENYLDYFASGRDSETYNLDVNLKNQLDDSAPIIEKGRWSNNEIKQIIKSLAVHDTQLRAGTTLTDTCEEVVDNLFPRFIR